MNSLLKYDAWLNKITADIFHNLLFRLSAERLCICHLSRKMNSKLLRFFFFLHTYIGLSVNNLHFQYTRIIVVLRLLETPPPPPKKKKKKKKKKQQTNKPQTNKNNKKNNNKQTKKPTTTTTNKRTKKRRKKEDK